MKLEIINRDQIKRDLDHKTPICLLIILKEARRRIS